MPDPGLFIVYVLVQVQVRLIHADGVAASRILVLNFVAKKIHAQAEVIEPLQRKINPTLIRHFDILATQNRAGASGNKAVAHIIPAPAVDAVAGDITAGRTTENAPGQFVRARLRSRRLYSGIERARRLAHVAVTGHPRIRPAVRAAIKHVGLLAARPNGSEGFTGNLQFAAKPCLHCHPLSIQANHVALKIIAVHQLNGAGGRPSLVLRCTEFERSNVRSLDADHLVKGLRFPKHITAVHAHEFARYGIAVEQ